MDKTLYMRVTPKYVIVYEPLNMPQIFRPRPGLKFRKPQVGCLYINKKTKMVTKRHISRIKREDVDRFLERNKPMYEMEEGVDLVAKLLLEHGIML